MRKVYDKCCGIDVHKKMLACCFIRGKKQEIQEFGTTTSELVKLAEWLSEGGCEIIAMESTASYWKPVYNILESSGLHTIIVNARHMKNVPGRKTDVKDAEWIADLLQHGLLEPSFIPDKDQRELRELVSYRKSLVYEKNRELNRLQKMLEGGNIKLSSVLTDINGQSSRNLINDLIKGIPINRAHLERMRSEGRIPHQLRATNEELEEACRGCLSKTQKHMIKELLWHLDQLDEHIKNLDGEIDQHMKEEEHKAVEAIKSVTGIGEDSAKIIISVIGTDMNRFPTDGHICSWAGLCPGNNESAKKKRNGKTTKGNKLLRTTLIVCAHSAVKVRSSYFYAQYKRIAGHRGSKKAYVAVAHSMLIAIYHVLKDGVAFQDLGSRYYDQFNKERKINSYLKKLKDLGWDGTATEAIVA